MADKSFTPDMEQLTQYAELLKAIAHPVRLCIVRGLITSGGCNVNHMQECLQMPQSTVSQHISRLRSAGIIKGERHGTEICYRIANAQISKVVEVLFGV